MTIQKYRCVPSNPNTNKHCVFAWVYGIPYKRGPKFKRRGLTTDGVDIYSYGLQIGRTGAFNKKILSITPLRVSDVGPKPPLATST